MEEGEVETRMDASHQEVVVVDEAVMIGEAEVVVGEDLSVMVIRVVTGLVRG